MVKTSSPAPTKSIFVICEFLFRAQSKEEIMDIFKISDPKKRLWWEVEKEGDTILYQTPSKKNNTGKNYSKLCFLWGARKIRAYSIKNIYEARPITLCGPSEWRIEESIEGVGSGPFGEGLEVTYYYATDYEIYSLEEFESILKRAPSVWSRIFMGESALLDLWVNKYRNQFDDPYAEESYRNYSTIPGMDNNETRIWRSIRKFVQKPLPSSPFWVKAEYKFPDLFEVPNMSAKGDKKGTFFIENSLLK